MPAPATTATSTASSASRRGEEVVRSLFIVRQLYAATLRVLSHSERERRAVDLDATAVALGDRFDDRQAEPRALTARGAAAGEAVEDRARLVRRDAGAFVGDAEKASPSRRRR